MIRYILISLLFVQLVFAEVFHITKEVYENSFNAFGAKSIKRIVYVKNKLEKINQQKKFIYAKLYEVNKLLNRVKYKKDKEHWGQDYNATFVEFIGSGAGDSLDFAFAKYAILIKMGLDQKKFRFYTTSKKGLNKIRYDADNYYVLGYLSNDNKEVVLLDCYTDKLFLKKITKLQKYKQIKISLNTLQKVQDQIYAILYHKKLNTKVEIQ